MLKFSAPYIKVQITNQFGKKIVFENEEYGGDIINFGFSKEIGPAGNFQFSIPDKRKSSISNNSIDLRLLIRSFSLAEIWIYSESNSTEWFYTIGVINDVFKDMDFSRGQAQRVWNVTGAELGIIFQNTQIWWDLSQLKTGTFGQQSPVTRGRGIANPKTIKSRGIRDIIYVVCKEWFEKVYNYNNFTFADGRKLSELLIVDKANLSEKLYVEEILSLIQLWNYSGDLWGLFNSLLSLPFHELYGTAGGGGRDKIVTLDSNTDVKLSDRNFNLILRPTPYDNFKLSAEKLSVINTEDVAHIAIDDSVISKKKLGTSGKQQFSFYSILYGGSVIPAFAQRILLEPIYDTEALQRYGYKPMEKNLNGMDIARDRQTFEKNKGTFLQKMQSLQEKMYNWYKYQDRFLEGIFEIKGNVNIQEGCFLDYGYDENNSIEDESEKGSYYIQGFTHNYTYGSPFTTIVNVVRGTPDDPNWFSESDPIADISVFTGL